MSSSLKRKLKINKAKAISAKLLEFYLKNKLDETGGKTGKKLEETGRNKESEEKKKTIPKVKTMTYLVFFF